MSIEEEFDILNVGIVCSFQCIHVMCNLRHLYAPDILQTELLPTPSKYFKQRQLAFVIYLYSVGLDCDSFIFVHLQHFFPY